MSQQTINVGASPNDGTGTPLRTAFQYTNSNFSELYTALGGGSGLPGATTQVIFNDGGTNLAGDAGLVYNKTTDALTVGGNVQAASGTITGDLTVKTNVLKVDSTNNRVGVGTASPSAYALHVAAPFASGRAGLLVETGEYNQKSLVVNSTNASLAANLLEVQKSGTPQFLVDASGNVGIGVTPSAGAGCLQLSSGINFPATQVASANANTLDDYEEGTFTPTVVGSTTAGTATYSAGAQNGYYTKVGRLVTVQVYMVWSGHTGTGNMRFAGLPFTTANITSNYASVTFGLVSNIALTAGNILTGQAELNNSFINALQTPVGGGAYTLVPLDTAGEVLFTCSYIAA